MARVLEISGFKNFLADGREDLREEVFDVLLCDDILKRFAMQLFEKVHDFFEDGQSFIL
jgi:hypothetical protein